MKLDRIAILAALSLTACASTPGPTRSCGRERGAVAPAPVSTASLTSAEIGDADAPSPRFGKAQHAVRVADEKRPVRETSPKKGDVFGDWK